MTGQAIIKGTFRRDVLVNIELGIAKKQVIIGRKNGASLMNEFTMQDIRVRATTIIDRMISCLANRGHGKGIVVKKNKLVKS